MEQNLAPTFRKRTISDCSALNPSKLGEMSRSPKRSLRYSTSASGSRSDETLSSDFVEEIPERKWHSTGLGTKYETKEYNWKRHRCIECDICNEIFLFSQIR